MRIKTEKSTVAFNTIGYIVLTFLTVICLIPFWVVLTGSVTPELEIINEGFKLWPNELTFEAYRSMMTNPGVIVRAYEVSIVLTVTGTALSLFLTAMAGYVLSRKDFKYRNGFSFYIYFTLLFSGGLIPWYILIVKDLQMKDSYMALLLPFLVSAWNIILMKGFMKSIPEDINESAKIDGAGDFTIFIKLILPLSTPGLATIGLFVALQYWNEWFLANLFITTADKYPLQFLLYRTLASAEALKTNIALSLNADTKPPSETLKMAAAVVATGPIVFLYPFVQRFFVKGLLIGSVKG
ncbi:carbohydrate ABC transporter permease [Cohnella candidum]|uniref:Carbohydrate ABC transporter permease n=1 Tax=Cohnella candidum TaxID=2674991 RepID=A0A3G3K1A0_9BACL|nr:carbohydrate ABC transporter permease [Cohnella candidum]AYQ73549.1 carbohydrate ABC transporter permease [Cohnella candidum]